VIEREARRIAERLVLGLALAFTTACSAGSPATGADDAGAADEPEGDGAATYAPTYHAVYNEVLVHNCALVFCHGGSGDYLQLDSEGDGYASLVGPHAQGPMCGPTGLARVTPGHPDQSLFFLKITNPPCGSRMPLDSIQPLAIRQIDQIGQWIACGALDGDQPCPTDAGVFSFDGAFFAPGADASGE
jgi:hypothetical protein